jgi:hypothetical protein
MSFISLEQSPFVGMSYEFAGENHGSAYIADRRGRPAQPVAA